MPRVAIIGAGIGGLAAALALRRRGIEAIVYERSASLGDIGGGINLGPNALKAFRALGIEDAAIAIGSRTEVQVVRSWRSGRILTRNERMSEFATRYGATSLTVHRADLLEILRRALPDDVIRRGLTCTGAVTDLAGARASFADGSEIEADVVLGADGIHSTVRASLFGPDAPRFTGCICWRGLVPVEAVPPGIDIRATTSWWGPHGHVVHYPVRRGELVNFVAHRDSDAWTGESWTHECDRSELIAAYRGWNEGVLRLFASSERYYKWALYDREPLERWGEGRVTLLGDAAHPMLPYLAQGAAMAIEDGYVLAALLTQMPEDPENALRQYERLRIPRTRRAQLGSRERAKENHLASRWSRLRRDVRLAVRTRFGADKTAFQAAWLYDYDVAAEAVNASNASGETA